MQLEGKRAVVTGGPRGIGRATALAFAAAGADVAVIDRDLDGAARFGEALGAASVADEIETFERVGMGVAADLSDPASVSNAFRAIEAKFGAINVLACVAGGAITPIEKSRPSDMSVADIKTVFDVNYLTAVLSAQAVIPGMRSRGGGTIILVSTIGATMTAPGGRLSHYGASKAAVAHLTRDLAAELGPSGIRVNAVAPGLIATARVAAQAAARKLATEEEARGIPMRRLGTAQDVARAILFLASDDAGYIAGQILSVCGGAALGAS